MKRLEIDTEKIILKINKVKNYLYTLLCVVRKKIFSRYSGQITYYNKGLGIVPSGNRWFTDYIIFGFEIRFIKRTVHY
jgi:hypothetical protein